MTGWAKLEKFGHTTLVGEVSEVDLFGGKLGRIVVLNRDGSRHEEFFGAGSVYGLTPLHEDRARQMMQPYTPYVAALTPLHRDADGTAGESQDEGARPVYPHEVLPDGGIRFTATTDYDGDVLEVEEWENRSPLEGDTEYSFVASRHDAEHSFKLRTTSGGTLVWPRNESPLERDKEYVFTAWRTDRGAAS